MKGLHFRIALASSIIAASVLLIATVTLFYQTHLHVLEYQEQVKDMKLDTDMFNFHFEQAVFQTVIWTGIVGLLLAFAVSFWVAKRISDPVIIMKNNAEQMAKGNLSLRNHVKESDEISDLGHSLNRLAEQLQTQETLRKHMTADVAHELRTPLATLKSHLEAMIDGVWSPSPERLSSCYEEVNRLSVMVGDLEQLAAVEAPDFHLTIAPESLDLLLQSIITSFQPAFDQKGVTISLVIQKPVKAPVDKARFAQMMSNLLNNALKFTPSGKMVSIHLTQSPKDVVIKIEDEGIGILDEDLPYIFERFYRVAKFRGRDTGGSGLGLTIVKRLVEGHRGTVTVTSQTNRGTCFEIHLPLANLSNES